MQGTGAEEEDILKLYELAIEEHHYYIDKRDNRIAFYAGLVSALVTALGVGLFQASAWYHFAYLALPSVLIWAISRVAIKHTWLTYRRQLESITVRAKIEQQLGLTRASLGDAADSHTYWLSEPLIPRRHLIDRETYQSSDAFVCERLAKGSQGLSDLMFRGAASVGILLAVALCFVALSKIVGWT